MIQTDDQNRPAHRRHRVNTSGEKVCDTPRPAAKQRSRRPPPRRSGQRKNRFQRPLIGDGNKHPSRSGRYCPEAAISYCHVNTLPETARRRED
jgi:hypothetical protein